MAQRLLGVLLGHDAFQHELALDDRAQAIDELPRHAGAVEVCDLRDVDAEEVGLPSDLVGERAWLVARCAVALIQATREKHVLDVVATLPDDRDHDGWGALAA